MDKPKILVIDDEEDFCFFVRENLINSGKFEVVIANSGARGIELAKSELPDIILLDLMMPDLSGEAVSEQIKENSVTAEIPIVFLTALVTREEGGKGVLKKIGEAYFIAKPVRTKELIEAINQVLS